MKRKAIVLNVKDTVASALVDLKAGEPVKVYISEREIKGITLIEGIRLGHKFALKNIVRGEDIFQSGISIDSATKPIGQG